MKFGYTIIYVESVEETLAFASHAMGDMNLGGEYAKADINEKPSFDFIYQESKPCI